MPEKPEVITVAKMLEKRIVGHTITKAYVYYDNVIVGDKNEFLEKIKDLNDFRYLCYMVVACRPLKTENSFKKSQYFYKSPSRTIKSI